MVNRFTPQARVLFLVVILLALLVLGLAPFLELQDQERVALFVLIALGSAYSILATRLTTRTSHGAVIYTTVPINVLLVTLGYAILHRALPSIWIMYFILPLSAALLYRPTTAYVSGLLSALAYIGVQVLFGMTTEHAAEITMNALVLVIVSVVTGLMVGSARRQEQELALFSKVGEALNAAIGIDELLEIIYTQLKQILPVDAYFVAFYDAVKDELDFAIGLDRDVREKRYRAPAGEGLSGQVIRTRESILIRDYPRVQVHLPQNLRWGTGEISRSLVIVPILRRSRQDAARSDSTASDNREILGVFSIQSYSPNTYSQDDLRLLEGLARSISYAFERAWLYDQIQQQRVGEQAVLLRLSQELLGLLEPRAVLERGLAIASETLRADFSHVWLPDENEDGYRMVPGVGWAKSGLVESAMQPGPRSDLAWSMSQRRPAVVPDTQKETRFEIPSFILEQGIRSAIIMPLLAGERVVGGLAVCNRQPREWSPVEVRLGSLIANQIALAHERTRLWQSYQARVQTLQILYETAQSFASISDLKETIRIVAESAARLMGCERCFVSLFDRDLVTLRAMRPALNVREEELTAFERTLAPQILSQRQIGQVFLANDLTSLPHDFREIAARFGARNLISAWMVVQNQPVGMLHLSNKIREPGFRSDDVRLLTTLANQAAVAIENARLFESENAERRKLQLLYDLGRELATNLDAQSIFRRAVSLTTQTLGGSLGEGFIYNPHTNNLRLETFAVPTDTELPEITVALTPNFSEGLAGWVAAHRQAVIVNDLHDDPRWVPYEPLDASSRSALVVPLVSGTQLLGVLSVLAERPGAFLPDQLDLMIALGRQISIALSNAQLYSQAQERAREFAALYDTSQELTAQPDLPLLLQMITERAKELLHAPAAGLAIYDANRRELIPTITQGYKMPEGLSIPLGAGVIGRVAATREPVIIDDYMAWENRLTALDPARLKSLVSVPMLYRGELIGTLAVIEIGDTRREFTSDDARLLSLFAAQAAGAIHNARLIEQLRLRANQFSLFYDAGLALNSALEPTVQLEYLVKIAARAARADRAAFFRFEAPSHEFVLAFSLGQNPEVKERLSQARFPLGEERGVVGWVGAHGIPVNIADVTRDTRWLVFDPEVQSALWVPVEHEKRLLGVLSVYATRSATFGMNDERLLALFANHVAVALENARLLSETQRRAQEAETLRQAASVVAETLQTEEGIERILVQLERVVPYDSASVQLLRDGYMEIVGGRGWLQPDAVRGLRFPVPGDNPNTLVVQDRQPLILAEPLKAYPTFAEGLHSHIRSWLGVPLSIQDRIIGMLAVDSLQSNYFTPDHARLITAFADQVALALENARLFGTAQRHAQESAALYKIALSLANVLDTNELLERVYEYLRPLLPADIFFIGLFDPATNLVKVAFATEEGQRVAEGLQLPLDDAGLTGWIIRARQPLLVRDLLHDPLPATPRHVTTPARSWLGVPLLARDRVLGVISIQSMRPEVFDEKDRRFLESLAGPVASALENARLFDEKRRRLAEQEAVNHIATTLREMGSLSPLLNYFLDATLALLDTTAGNILLFDPLLNRLDGFFRRGWFTGMVSPPARKGEGISGHVLETGEPYLIHEFASDPLARVVSRPYMPTGWGGVCVPIRNAQEVIGTLTVGVAHPRELTPSQVQLLTTLAEILGFHIARFPNYNSSPPASKRVKTHRFSHRRRPTHDKS